MPGPIQAKNRAPAPIQITAEQLLREAKERGLEDVQKQPKQFITDKEELLQYQNAKRKDFEDQIRRNRHHIGIWCRYALWEASLKEFERSRSVFERALSESICFYKRQTAAHDCCCIFDYSLPESAPYLRDAPKREYRKIHVYSSFYPTACFSNCVLLVAVKNDLAVHAK